MRLSEKNHAFMTFLCLSPWQCFKFTILMLTKFKMEFLILDFWCHSNKYADRIFVVVVTEKFYDGILYMMIYCCHDMQTNIQNRPGIEFQFPQYIAISLEFSISIKNTLNDLDFHIGFCIELMNSKAVEFFPYFVHNIYL